MNQSGKLDFDIRRREKEWRILRSVRDPSDRLLSKSVLKSLFSISFQRSGSKGNNEIQGKTLAFQIFCVKLSEQY